MTVCALAAVGRAGGYLRAFLVSSSDVMCIDDAREMQVAPVL